MSAAEKAIGKVMDNPVMFGVAALVIIGGVYYLARKSLADVAEAGGGLITGNNAATKGTVYEGAGVFGTLGGAMNKTVPILDDIGGWLGGKVYDLTHPDYDPNDGKLAAPNIVANGAEQTDSLWGRIGSVLLRY